MQLLRVLSVACTSEQTLFAYPRAFTKIHVSQPAKVLDRPDILHAPLGRAVSALDS